MTTPIALFLLLILGVTPGCRSVRRDIRESLPEFLRSDPGEKEMEIFRTAKRSLEYGPEDLDRQARRMEAIRALAASDEPDETVDEIKLFLEEEPGSLYDEEVRFLQVKESMRDEEFGEAFVALRNFAANHPVSDYGPEGVERAFEMAESYLAGERDHLWGLFSNQDDGQAILEWIVQVYPASPRAADAQWTLAQFAMEEGEFERAIDDFDLLVEVFPNSEWAPAARFYRGFCRDSLVKGVVYDPEMKREAREAFEAYLQVHSDGEFAAEARERRQRLREQEAEQVLATAEWYIDRGRPFGARFYLVDVLSRYRDTRAAERARELLPEQAETVGPPAPESDS